MKTSALLFVIACFSVVNLKAQDKPVALIKGESASVEQNIVKVEALFPSLLALSYEKKMAQSISLYTTLGAMSYYGGGTIARDIYGASPYYIFMPQITVQSRFYHNLGKRAASHKNTNNNAANYVGLTSRFYHEGLYLTNAERLPNGSAVLDLMISYGMQRSFFKRINFDVAFQPGLRITNRGAELLVGINLQLGFIVFSN